MHMFRRRPFGEIMHSSHAGIPQRAQRVRVSTPRWRTHTASGSDPSSGATAGVGVVGIERTRLVSKRPSHG